MFKNIKQNNGSFEFQLLNSDKIYKASQKSDIISYFCNFLNKESFDIIIELGTFTGGLSIVLNEIIKKNQFKTKIYTFDIAKKFNKNVEEYYKENNIQFLIGSCFSEEIIDYIKNLIKNKRVCLLCDNGNKVNEFSIYSKIISEKDFIMAHDYKNDLNPTFCDWKWHEIKFSQIKNYIEENNLKIYKDINFEEVAWCCYFK